MDASIKDSCMEKVPTHGPMDLSIKAPSRIIKSLEMVDSPGLMAATTKDMSSMVKDMDKENILVQKMAQVTKVLGKTVSKKDLEILHLQMELFMRENSIKD